MKTTIPSVLLLVLLAPAIAPALDVAGGADQFAGGFQPSNAPWGGFGGGTSAPRTTPAASTSTC